MRPSTSCQACRVHRRKCRVVDVGSSCMRCQQFNVNCSLDHRSALEVSRSVPQAQITFVRAQLQARDSDEARPIHARDDNGGIDMQHGIRSNTNALQKDLVQHYFRAIHDKHHSLFHEPSVENDLDNGTLPDVVLYAMMALAARFASHAAILCIPANRPPRFPDSSDEKLQRRRTRGRAFASKAKGLLDMTDISVTTIQACVLLGTICFTESQTEAEALYYAVANRLAQVMDLPNRPAENEIQRQVHLRIWWTLYMIDIWSSHGLGPNVPRQLEYRADIPLPIEEISFLTLGHSLEDVDVQSSGIWAEMTRLAHIWDEIHNLNQITVTGILDPVSLNSRVAVLATKLNNWSVRLPEHLTETRENLERYAQAGLGSALAALHLGFHYYNEVLFYQFLASDIHSPAISADYYGQCCKAHAKRFCELVHSCRSTPRCEVVYVMLGHMLVITSTVYIHTLLFSSNEEEINAARQQLEQNFKILTELQSYWVRLDVSLSRLEAFHRACTTSIEHPFRMDRWLVAFILEHGMSVNEKFSDELSARPNVITETVESESSIGNLQEWYSSKFSVA